MFKCGRYIGWLGNFGVSTCKSDMATPLRSRIKFYSTRMLLSSRPFNHPAIRSSNTPTYSPGRYHHLYHPTSTNPTTTAPTTKSRFCLHLPTSAHPSRSPQASSAATKMQDVRGTVLTWLERIEYETNRFYWPTCLPSQKSCALLHQPTRTARSTVRIAQLPRYTQTRPAAE